MTDDSRAAIMIATIAKALAATSLPAPSSLATLVLQNLAKSHLKQIKPYSYKLTQTLILCLHFFRVYFYLYMCFTSNETTIRNPTFNIHSLIYRIELSILESGIQFKMDENMYDFKRTCWLGIPRMK